MPGATCVAWLDASSLDAPDPWGASTALTPPRPASNLSARITLTTASKYRCRVPFNCRRSVMGLTQHSRAIPLIPSSSAISSSARAMFASLRSCPLRRMSRQTARSAARGAASSMREPLMRRASPTRCNPSKGAQAAPVGRCRTMPQAPSSLGILGQDGTRSAQQPWKPLRHIAGKAPS